MAAQYTAYILTASCERLDGEKSPCDQGTRPSAGNSESCRRSTSGTTTIDLVSEHITSAPSTQDASTRPPRTPTVAVWLSAAALLLCILLALPYLALRSPVALLVFVLAVGTGIVGIVLGVRARRSASARGGWALICALVALLITAVMTVVFIVGMISATSINKVELRGQGPQGVSATFSNDMGERTEKWPSEGWAKFNTEGSWAELTMELPDDADPATLSCQIIWNGEIVVDETSDSGAVTCRYDAD